MKQPHSPRFDKSILLSALIAEAEERGHRHSHFSVLRNPSDYYWSLVVCGTMIEIKRLNLWLTVVEGSKVIFDCADPSFDFAELWEYVEQEWGQGRSHEILDCV